MAAVRSSEPRRPFKSGELRNGTPLVVRMHLPIALVRDSYCRGGRPKKVGHIAVGAVATAGVPVLFAAVVIVGALALLAIVALGIVVRQTFAVALYRYATTSRAQGPFDERDLSSPFGQRGLFR